MRKRLKSDGWWDWNNIILFDWFGMVMILRLRVLIMRDMDWFVAEDINNDICCFVGKIILSYSINNLTMYQITLNSQSNPIQMLPIANTFKPIIQFWPIQSILILPTFQFSNSLSFFNGFLFLKTLLYYKHHIKLFYLCLLLLLINESTRIPDSSVRF